MYKSRGISLRLSPKWCIKSNTRKYSKNVESAYFCEAREEEESEAVDYVFCSAIYLHFILMYFMGLFFYFNFK